MGQLHQLSQVGPAVAVGTQPFVPISLGSLFVPVHGQAGGVQAAAPPLPQGRAGVHPLPAAVKAERGTIRSTPRCLSAKRGGGGALPLPFRPSGSTPASGEALCSRSLVFCLRLPPGTATPGRQGTALAAACRRRLPAAGTGQARRPSTGRPPRAWTGTTAAPHRFRCIPRRRDPSRRQAGRGPAMMSCQGHGSRIGDARTADGTRCSRQGSAATAGRTPLIMLPAAQRSAQPQPTDPWADRKAKRTAKAWAIGRGGGAKGRLREAYRATQGGAEQARSPGGKIGDRRRDRRRTHGSGRRGGGGPGRGATAGKGDSHQEGYHPAQARARVCELEDLGGAGATS